MAAIAAHVSGIADAEAQAAARTQGSCSAGTGLDSDTARIVQQVRAALAGGGAGSVEVAGLSSPGEQIPMARAVVATGIQMRLPARGQVIALATALQESGLRNLDYGDLDSLGLFQQRPSQGWGSREQILDPVYASTKFYKALTALKDWELMPLTVAAQKVQASAFPDAYAKHEPLATALQLAIAPTLGAPPPPGLPVVAGPAGTACPGSGGDTDWGTIPPGTIPAGYQIPSTAPVPVQSAIRWALGQLGTPYQWGGSCTNPHGNAASGRCDCSSLMQRAYGIAGIELSRTTYTQVNEGTPVPANAIAPGDLVFSRGSATVPEHVAMAIGSGLVVHAPRPGRNVEVVALDTITVLAVRRITT
ncbi:NlpC/P60 family protein [Streptomyces sp. H27-H1]|uniref:C40 family peptidase n=1 Tax=Streptomyces sp. H27-H1 TaxID=2996461 RepID=UPI0022717115|nr:NlpC/P60 family protein [Streptomyces sp. H27-H1]MCY0930990.1 NlpC/P60 family protein [Streptomyces sp. H27-H1]